MSQNSAETLYSALATCMLADRFSLKNRINQARDLAKQNKPIERNLTEIAQKIKHSQIKAQL